MNSLTSSREVRVLLVGWLCFVVCVDVLFKNSCFQWRATAANLLDILTVAQPIVLLSSRGHVSCPGISDQSAVGEILNLTKLYYLIVLKRINFKLIRRFYLRFEFQ